MKKIATAVMMIGLLPTFALAQTADERQKALIDQQQKATAEAEKLKSEAEAQSNDLSTLQERLVAASGKERELAERLDMLENRTHTLESTQTDLMNSLAGKRQHLAELLVGLARLSRLPPELGLLREDNTKDAINTALLLESALPEVQNEARQLSSSLTALDEVQKQLHTERRALADARAAQDKEQAQIEGMIKARQQKLKLTKRQQNEIDSRLSKLREESANVEDLIRKVASPSMSKSDKPPPVLALRGGFMPPAVGPVRQQYGETNDVGGKALGITFGADQGGRIVSPARGKVMFAGPFKGYGQIVIIEHDDDMHSLVAGFGRLDVTVGQKVSQGEPLGIAGRAGVMPAAKDNTPAEVYFELRHEGEPIDPRLHQR